jgi:hypothetical protein
MNLPAPGRSGSIAGRGGLAEHTAPYNIGQGLGPTRWRSWRPLPVLLVVLVGLAVVVGRVLHDSRTALLAGEAGLARDDRDGRTEAVRHFHHAVRMYAPGSPYVRRALDHLDQVAQTAASAGDVALERQALEAVRGGLLGARSLYTPFAERVRAADARLAVIYAAIEDPAVAEGATPEQRLAFHRERLARRPGAGAGASALALLGFGAWLGAAVVFVRRGIDRTLTVRRGWALWCGVAFVLGLTLFLVGLRLA